jgi:hypothetical protein
MQSAIDIRGNQVSIERALSGGPFFCPECVTQVFVRIGAVSCFFHQARIALWCSRRVEWGAPPRPGSFEDLVTPNSKPILRIISKFKTELARRYGVPLGSQVFNTRQLLIHSLAVIGLVWQTSILEGPRSPRLSTAAKNVLRALCRVEQWDALQEVLSCTLAVADTNSPRDTFLRLLDVAAGISKWHELVDDGLLVRELRFHWGTAPTEIRLDDGAAYLDQSRENNIAYERLVRVSSFAGTNVDILEWSGSAPRLHSLSGAEVSSAEVLGGAVALVRRVRYSRFSAANTPPRHQQQERQSASAVPTLLMIPSDNNETLLNVSQAVVAAHPIHMTTSVDESRRKHGSRGDGSPTLLKGSAPRTPSGRIKQEPIAPRSTTISESSDCWLCRIGTRMPDGLHASTVHFIRIELVRSRIEASDIRCLRCGWRGWAGDLAHHRETECQNIRKANLERARRDMRQRRRRE